MKSRLVFPSSSTVRPNMFIAWTLMGHEYIEMKNTAAAIELTDEQWMSMAEIIARGTV